VLGLCSWLVSDCAHFGSPEFITDAAFSSDVVKDMEAKDPVVFQANRSNLRLFSMTEVGFSLGTMLGPLLTGSLFETIGFFYMTVALGKSFDESNNLQFTNCWIAAICLVQAAVSWRWLDTKPPSEEGESSA
jgi:MFS family permease